MTNQKVWPTPETAARKLTDEQILDAVRSMTPLEEAPRKTHLYIVDTISTFRMRYVIEAESLEHAYDEVTMVDSGCPEDAFDEVTQLHVGEQIIDGRKISKKKFDKMLVELAADKNELCSHWMGDKLIRKIDYTR